MRRKSKESKHILFIGGIVLFLLAIVCIGVYIGFEPSKADKVGQSSLHLMKVHKDLEPSICLETPSETSDRGDVYVVRGGNRLELSVTANVDTRVQVKSNTLPSVQRKVHAGDTENITSTQFISLQLYHPEHVTLRINGCIIETKGLKKPYSFYFKRGS